MPKFVNKNLRANWWDYRWGAVYFITICTDKRKSYFGEIINNKIVLNQVGVIANVLWFEIKNHFADITLDEIVVMPNHVHGILYLHPKENIIQTVVERHAFQPQSPISISKIRFQNQGKKSISSIIGNYKSAVTKHANRLGLEFKWQSRFHDHIIRDLASLKFIQNYIANNPSLWDKDKYFQNK